MEIIDGKRKNRELTVTFESVGWKSLLQMRGGTSRILILKSVVRGLCLDRGMPIFSYVGQDHTGRPVMISYLDGNPRIPSDSEGKNDEG